ncbi:MAG TPA: UPF0280 family protein [Syntrophales bacterium]|nr:UPF0280 family protein [Syntrophales bacterium]
MDYQERTYRNRISTSGLVSFTVHVKETDLLISCDADHSQQAFQSVCNHRGYIESYIRNHPDFLTSLSPLPDDQLAPPIIRDMLKATQAAEVGPMASVAGAISEYVALDLLGISRNIVIENGGDIYAKAEKDIQVGIFAGNSPLTFKVGLLLKVSQMPLGVCTSSGTVGHSFSFGRADAVCVVSKSATMADAAATSIGNRITGKDDIRTALAEGMKIPDVLGVLIIVGERLGAVGDIELI